ncbi:MAG: cytidine deaminase [Cloacibacterium sp.]|jgi:cytidine deaminase|nr:cytidine deaminase [Cloacibacterium sp.]
MEKEWNFKYEVLEIEDLSEQEKKLFESAKLARERAYAPYSDFWVGCSVLLENGEIYTGNNQENAAYPSGLCAERTALYWLGANFPHEIVKKILIVGGPKDNSKTDIIVPPCGSCRQSILEYETKQNQNIEIYFANLKGRIFKTRSIRDLLPFSFDFTFLM